MQCSKHKAPPSPLSRFENTLLILLLLFHAAWQVADFWGHWWVKAIDMASCVNGKWTQRGSWRAPIWIPPRISVHMLRPWAGHCTHACLGDDHLDLCVIVWFQRFVEIWGVSPALCTTNYSKRKTKVFCTCCPYFCPFSSFYSECVWALQT